MGEVRTKYKELFDQVNEAVKTRHPELDAIVVYPTQFWGSGSIGFGRKSWPGGDTGWPSGLWLDNLRLERLASKDSEPPRASIWFSNKSKSNLGFVAARLAISAAAKDLLTSQELKNAKNADSQNDLLWLPAPSKDDLRRSLSDGDGQRFVALFVSQFDMMARFVPVLDKVFRECLAKE